MRTAGTPLRRTVTTNCSSATKSSTFDSSAFKSSYSITLGIAVPPCSTQPRPDGNQRLHRIHPLPRGKSSASPFRAERVNYSKTPSHVARGARAGVSRFFIFPRACRSGRARFHRLGRGSCALQSRAEALFCRLLPGKSGYWRKLAPQNTSTPALRPLDVPDARR